MRLSIYSLQNTLFSGEVEKVTLPTPQGEITVLKEHIPLIALVRPGYVRYTSSGTQKMVKLAGAVLEVRPESEIVILGEEESI